MLPIGAEVLDRRTGARAQVAYVEAVPEQHDLFGNPLPAHERYTLRFDDWRAANDRTAADLERVA